MRLGLRVGFALFGDFPWFNALEVLVKRTDGHPDFVERPVKAQFVDSTAVRPHVVFTLWRVTDNTSLVTAHHTRDARYQVAKVIAQLVVVGVLELFPGKITVVLRRNVAGKEIAERVEAVPIDDLDGVDHVTDGLAHL